MLKFVVQMHCLTAAYRVSSGHKYIQSEHQFPIGLTNQFSAKYQTLFSTNNSFECMHRLGGNKVQCSYVVIIAPSIPQRELATPKILAIIIDTVNEYRFKF